ncbi:13286_t:CDS:2 [Funneliformis caledonium]|uniref:13286_t:CDS:1 n=1 Tax=Funneliformis caledonium TaxID=1117310 RepID=A0A9N9DGP0_9GLOM|nr:13286_t:CDS:2 [Funneliformis caledonium]
MQQPPPTTSSGPSTVPQFVVIHDQLQQCWKHPAVHYVFEDEPFPSDVPKDSYVLVNLGEDGESIAAVHSLSHKFQVTNCKVSSTPQMNANAGTGGGKDSNTNLMLTIEGMSANQPAKNRSKQYKEEFDQSSSVFGLDDLVYDFKRRNELLKQTLLFSQNQELT